MTNNQAEYMALLTGLHHLAFSWPSLNELLASKLKVYGDSMLVIKQITMNWKCKNMGLLPYRDAVREKLFLFRHWSARWHSRENSVNLFGH